MTHLILIICTSGTLGLLFIELGFIDLSSPKMHEDKVVEIDTRRIRDARFDIEILSANWGVNCNPAIARIQQRYAGISTEELTKQKITIPEMIAPNGKLALMADWCNGYGYCERPIFGADFADSNIGLCIRELSVTYRCFSFDRKRSLSKRYGTLMQIECRPDT